MSEPAIAPSAANLESGHPAAMWYGLVAAPASWVLQSSLAWWVTGRACADGRAAGSALSSGTVRGVLLGLCALALLAGAIGLATAWRAWRQANPHPGVLSAHGASVPEYVATAGFLVSAVFLLAIAWTGLPAAMVNLCEGMR